MIPPPSLSLSLCSVRSFHRYNNTLSLSRINVTTMMDVEFQQKRAPSTSSSTSSPSSSTYSSSCDRFDRLLDTQEIQAAQTLAHLAMRDSHSADKCCNKRATIRVTRESPTHHSDLFPSPLGPGGQAVEGQQLDTFVETGKNQQDDCSEHMKVEQDADSLPNTSCSLVRCSKTRRNLTEEEKEARRVRRILANRESARQTIRRRQALCEELTRKAATLVVENENLKREKELALKEYQSLETTNKDLKSQIAKSINTEVEKTPAEPESSRAEITPLSGNGPWCLYNHFPVPQIFWPSIFQSSNPVHLQNTTFNSLTIPSNANVPCSSESESCRKQNNLINDNQTQNPFYMFPCPWLFPLPQFGNGQSSPSSSLKDNLGKQCSSSSSLNTLNTLANVDYQAALPIKRNTEASSWTEARPINDPSCATPRFSLDGGERKTGCNTIEKIHGPALGCNGHASLVKQEHELQLHSASNNKVSSTAYSATSLEKKQEQFICQGKNLADAVAAAEARKRRKELTKQKNIHSRQSRMQC